MNNRLRIIVSAYQCGPGLGSVSQIGWEWYARLSEKVDVTLLTHVRNKSALEKAGAPVGNSQVIYIDTEWFAGPLYRLASKLFPRSEHPVFLISSLDFYLYDIIALKTLKRMQKSGETWDIAHQVTPVSPLAATWLYKLGIPLVLGPWNGGLVSPKEYPEIMQAESGWLYPIRKLGGLLDAVIGSTRNARLILTATKATRQVIAPRYQAKCVFMLENGVDLSLFHASSWPTPPDEIHPLNILFVGRLLPMKGLGMLLEAVAQLVFPWRLTIVGSGSEEAALRGQAETLGLQDRVTFTGGLPLAEVGKHMAAAHVFCLPSVRESGGAVLLEAMAAARPVIALAYGGPAELVDEEVGCPIPSTGRAAVIPALAQSLTDVRDNPERWRQRGLAGRERVEQRYAWPVKIDAAIALYRQCLEKH
jgi:glycosyltransferase involved in cell wall biosynthesis